MSSNTLSDDEVTEIAAMFPHAEYQPDVEAMPLCSFCDGSIDDHKANCVVPHVHALCATVRALRKQLAQRENDCRHNHVPLRTWLDLKEQLAQENQQRGLVIMSALINFVDWLNAKNVFSADEVERGEFVKRFLAAHSEGEGYFMQADQIAEILGEPFRQEQP